MSCVLFLLLWRLVGFAEFVSIVFAMVAQKSDQDDLNERKLKFCFITTNIKVKNALELPVWQFGENFSISLSIDSSVQFMIYFCLSNMTHFY